MKLSKTISVCFVAGVTAITAVAVSHSFPARADVPLTTSQRAEIRKFGKVSGSLEVTIAPISPSVHAVGDAIVLEATIVALQDYQNVQFEWVLPDDILATSALQSDLGPMAMGTTQTIRLEALSQTAENRLIILHALGTNDGQRLGQSTQYNTVNQTRIETAAYMKLQSLKATSTNATASSASTTGHKFKMMQ